jgi:hypothetical protein
VVRRAAEPHEGVLIDEPGEEDDVRVALVEPIPEAPRRKEPSAEELGVLIEDRANSTLGVKGCA